MKRPGNTVVTSVSIPSDLSEQIEKALYKHRRKMCQQNTSRSKFISMMIQKGLQS